MLWFGESWGAPVCDPETQVEVLEGTECGYCGRPIEAGDRGLAIPHVDADGETLVPWHIACFERSVLPPRDRT
jgi:hypothetical protein